MPLDVEKLIVLHFYTDVILIYVHIHATILSTRMNNDASYKILTVKTFDHVNHKGTCQTRALGNKKYLICVILIWVQLTLYASKWFQGPERIYFR